jgi:glycosyltransferase involved in cell wall biosynthesis
LITFLLRFNKGEVKLRIAIVHDWLVTYAGAEKVLEQMLNVFPDADLFSIVDFIPQDQRSFIHNKKVQTSFIQKIPGAKKRYRNLLPLMPLAIEQFDLSKYDLVLSSSHAVAKGVLTGPDQVHISYVHSPIRYAWDLQHQYLKESGLDSGPKGLITKWLLHKIRLWDYRTSNGVDHFVSNSKFISKRIKKVYGRDSQVLYPPVDVSRFEFKENKEDFFITASRMVPYKKIDLIVEAFSKMPDKKLVVIGDGPDFNKIKSKAGENITLLGYQSSEILIDYMQRAKAFVFAAEEDFGITPVEAQACGTPVIAFGKGGALETIKGYGISENPTGVFFSKQEISDIISAVNKFENIKTDIDPIDCRKNAISFSEEEFRENLKKVVKEITTDQKLLVEEL